MKIAMSESDERKRIGRVNGQISSELANRKIQNTRNENGVPIGTPFNSKVMLRLLLTAVLSDHVH